MRDILIEIWTSVRRNKLRTILTGFAVAWGIFMLIVLLGAGNGLLNAVRANSTDFVSNSMMVGPGATSVPYDGLQAGRQLRLNGQDLLTTGSEKFSGHIDKVSAIVRSDSKTVSFRNEYSSVSLQGVSPEYEDIEKIEVLAGRFINEIDMAERRKVLVMGRNQAEELSGGADPFAMLGQNVAVDAFSYKIVGIYRTDESSMDQDVYIPFSTLHTINAKGENVDRIVFTFHGLPTEEANEQFEEQYRRSINANHRAAPYDRSTIWIWNRFTQSMQMDKGLSIINIALWIIGIFTLLGGIVGVSNIMLITVKERTHEFGIRKAIGAKPSAILRLIITESILITGFFGYIGMVLGLVACEFMDASLGHSPVDLGFTQVNIFVNPTVGLDIALQATVLLIIAGIAAGFFPARKAAGVKPIEALRAE